MVTYMMMDLSDPNPFQTEHFLGLTPCPHSSAAIAMAMAGGTMRNIGVRSVGGT